VRVREAASQGTGETAKAMMLTPLRTQRTPFGLIWVLVSILLLSSCSGGGGGGGSSGGNVSPLTVKTTALPSGLQGTAYSATLAGTGGVLPYAWKITGGTLPAGLSLNETSGTITGTPTEAVAGVTLTFVLTDSASPHTAPLPVSPSAFSQRLRSRALPFRTVKRGSPTVQH
jgi:hypothetical protein